MVATGLMEKGEASISEMISALSLRKSQVRGAIDRLRNTGGNIVSVGHGSTRFRLAQGQWTGKKSKKAREATLA